MDVTPSGPTAAPAKGASGKTTPAPLTRQQRDALFATAAKPLTPENGDPLTPWRHQILHGYKQGYSIRQIAEILRSPGIGVKASQRAIKRVLAAEPALKVGD